MMHSIYLDHNSTTPIDPRVLEAMTRVQRDGLANPASQHHLGRRARRLLEEAREGIAGILGADVSSLQADRLIFTSGGTEANNLAILGLAAAACEAGSGGVRRIIVSAIEHPSVLLAAEVLERRGYQVERLKVTHEGVFDEQHLTELLAEPATLASLMLANHETGVLQPVAALAARCQAAKVPVHTDAVQAVGKVPVNFRQLGVAAMTIAPHKFHGPLGIGGLLLRNGVALEPALFGGFQQAGLRPGTESVALAVGFHEALVIWKSTSDVRERQMTALRELLEQQLKASLPDAVIAGEGVARLPQTINIAFPGFNRQALVMSLDLAGIACSTGSACASGSSEPSPVLTAMGLEKGLIEGSIRLSLGALTTAADIAEATSRILNCVKHLRTSGQLAKTAAATT